jgi:hypothetical protein
MLVTDVMTKSGRNYIRLAKLGVIVLLKGQAQRARVFEISGIGGFGGCLLDMINIGETVNSSEFGISILCETLHIYSSSHSSRI